MTIEEMAESLDDAGRLSVNEIGEYWVELAQLATSHKTGASDEFRAALEKEVAEQHALLVDEFRLVEKEISHTYTERRLVHYTECAE